MVFKSELSSQNDSMTVIHLNGIDTYARSPLMSKNNNATNINGTKLKTTIKYIFFPPIVCLNFDYIRPFIFFVMEKEEKNLFHLVWRYSFIYLPFTITLYSKVNVCVTWNNA